MNNMDHTYTNSKKTFTVRYKHKCCCVPQCTASPQKKGISFHKFPTDRIIKKKWEVVLRMAMKSSKTSQVCSEHFLTSDFVKTKKLNSPVKVKRLAKNVVPSQNLPIRSFDRPLDSPRKMKIIQRAERNTKRKLHFSLNESCSKNDLFDQPHILSEDINSNDLLSCLTFMKTPENKKLNDCQLKLTNSEIVTEDKEIQVDLLDLYSISKNTIMDLLRSDSDLNSFTGLLNLSALDKLVTISDIVLMKLNYTVNFSIDTRQRIFLTLTKLKLNMSYNCLAVLFGISAVSCKNYFIATVDLLYLVLKPSILWSSKEVNKRNIPKCFLNFIDTRVVLDCTETTVERPKCLTCRIRTYSHYKGNHTIKCMIGISPDGLVSFLSSVYGGRASDKFIFNDSGILNKCEEGDSIMVDKGFLIDKECTDRGVKLHRPPFLGKQKQLSSDDGILNCEVARARVHVERTIQRIKIFKIFQHKVAWAHLRQIDKIMCIVCGVVNLSNPIISKIGF